MFKLESYITPVILSYVEKYVRNFKPEQSQVSLWGGDASFQNLDLRLEVLEEQLNLPFTFVSGHIHELLIHVPWVKITSEPIVITINTIECILNLKDQRQTETSTTALQSVELTPRQEELPLPAYIKSVVAKVINNITINCNNLILKYVEEDIVLSVNVRFLSMRMVNDEWEPAFITLLPDVLSYEETLRKVITVEDLTLCLDKMDTAGKIEVYQDPVLYRCSMVIRLTMNYRSYIAKYASLTRFDLHCEKMEFSITEQQLPMLLRLITLVTALQTKQPSIRKHKPVTSFAEDRTEIVQEEIDQASGASPEVPGWSGWAWNVVTSILPGEWDSEGLNDQQIASIGHTIHVGLYIDDAVLTFKTVESLQEQLFYKSRKCRYNSFLTLHVTSAVMSILMKGISMNNMRFGLGTISLHPQGPCSCGCSEVTDNMQVPLYMKAGKIRDDYLKDSLFDSSETDNSHMKNYYNEYNVYYHVTTFNVASLLERCPAFAIDIVHSIEIPDDFPLEKLAEFGSNFEYSNFPERKIIRYVVGELKIRLCSGLMHRINEVKRAAAKHDYNAYAVSRLEPTVDELPPVTVEEYEALQENVSIIETCFTVKRFEIQFQLSDHGILKSVQQREHVGNSETSLDPIFSDDPHLSIETEEIVGSIVQPMYAFRLASCASRQSIISSDMLNNCYNVINVKVSGIQSQLHLTKNCNSWIVVPFNANLTWKSLIYPQYWRNSSLIQEKIDCEIDGITVSGTKPKLMVVIAIGMSIVDPTDTSNPLLCSSLFTDACNEKDPVYLGISLENIQCKRIKTSTNVSMKLNVDFMKTFALNNTQHALILSGPEADKLEENECTALLSLILQYSDTAFNEIYPPVLSFRVSEVRCSLEPLLFQWLQYQAVYDKTRSRYIVRHETEQPSTKESFSDTGTRKKIFRTLHESVHSLSDKEKMKSDSRTDWSKGVSGAEDLPKNVSTNNDVELQDLRRSGIFVKITEFYPLWQKLVLCGFLGHVVIYIPTTTMDGVGANGIESAKDRALNNDPDLQIFAMKCPTILIHSVNVQLEQLSQYLLRLPIQLPLALWSHEYRTFPWTFSLSNFHCYTLKKNSRKNFIRKIDITATIDVTTKPGASDGIGNCSLAGLGLCVYVDTSPVLISICEEQVALLNNILSEITNVMNVVYHSEKEVLSQPPIGAEGLFSDVPKSPSSFTQILYAEDSTTASSITSTKDDSEQENNSIVLTAMIQWTIAKITFKLYVTERLTDASMKLVLEMEDIITTLDWQPIYLKLKNKITTVTVCHYKRTLEDQNWMLGDYAGLIMCGREDSLDQTDETGFLSMIMTKAQCGNVHTRWGAQKHQKLQKKLLKRNRALSTEGYITEIDINLQMIDIILPLNVLNKFFLPMKPFLMDTNGSDQHCKFNANFKPQLKDTEKFGNKSLPLIYLEFKGMNLMLPTCSSTDYRLQHDLLIMQLDGISITPSAENPICRTILRSDIYQLAAQLNILNVPGSAVEDRQYQVNVKGICAYTTTWQNYQRNVTKHMSQLYLYTMNENPALEWNNLRNDSSSELHFSTSPLISRFDLRLIIAPAVILNPSEIICGSAFEVTCLTDIDVSINMDQIKLISAMYNEIAIVLDDYSDETEMSCEANMDMQSSISISSTPHKIPKILCSREHEHTDSGVDFESSSVNYIFAEKLTLHEKLVPLPSEFLINCGTITISLYTMTKTSNSSDAEADKSENDKEEISCSQSLLLYAKIIEPNVYISQLRGTEKIQISCFDVALSLCNIQESSELASAKKTESKLSLIESKSGDAHPDTGIPPSFLVIKSERNLNTSMRVFVDVGRPTRINYSILAMKQIEIIKSKIIDSFVDRSSVEFYRKKHRPRNMVPLRINNERKNTIFASPDLRFMTKQIVLCLTTSAGSKVLTSVSSLTGHTSKTTKPDRIYGNLTINSFVISMNDYNEIKVFLNPLCCHVTLCLLWETWQDADAFPQVQIQADCESMFFEFGPQQLKIFLNILEDYYIFLDHFELQGPVQVDEETNISPAAEQHYKDDLKAGAFQFVDGHTDELPLPYQVMFYNHPEQAMAWRYPQPRIITGLHVAPIPFNTSDSFDFDLEVVPCTLEYWSDSHMAYQRYIEFYLSETDNYHPDLPTTAPALTVASVWRVVLSSHDSPHSTVISTQVLAACLRIDSYFNEALIPNIQATLNIEMILVSFFNHIKTSAYENLPHPLSSFRLNGLIPAAQCFIQLEQQEGMLVFNRWSSGANLIDISGCFSIKVLDYSLLHMHELLDRLESKIQVAITESDETNVSMECYPFSIKFSPSIGHTLAVSANLWMAALNEENKNVVILTRIVIANDTNIAIRFGQSGSTDNVLLHSRECHFYSWRSAGTQLLHVAIESSGWTWSQPFSVNKNGKQLVTFGNSSTFPVICVRVASLSATQKLITFSGLLVITNRLAESFEMKLIHYQHEARNTLIVSDELHSIPGNSRSPSIVLENNANMAMRLRFSTSTNLSWTGDIPLKPNSKWGQPWLVKVPLQERGQFLSIWTRIVTEIIHGKTRVLAILSPLYMIKSYLPVPVKVHIETPSLKTSLDATINGRGEHQQLYCPGTFEHTHQLTFQFETGIQTSNPYVPLSYSSVEQRQFFKRPEKENIDAILTELENPVDISPWPFQFDDPNIWIPTEQPQTHVQVKYQDAGLVSSTLLLELQPWCFILNSLGCQISLVSEDIELYQVPHNGIITPPKLEGTFHLKINIDDNYYASPALQLARLDWSQGFYMPKIRGLIPVEGNIKTLINCGPNICVASINSKMHESMRVVRVTASHVICNFTSHGFRVATLVVDDASSNINLSEDNLPCSFRLEPSENRSLGTPVIQWHMVNAESTSEHVALYISLSRQRRRWCCPIRVDQNVTRRCTAVFDRASSIPVVVTTQEENGTTYIFIHIDDHPQLYIMNSCPFHLLLGEANSVDNGICRETSHFSWRCEVESGSTCYYSAPSVASRLPDCQTTERHPKLLLSALPQNHHKKQRADKQSLLWSRPVSISEVKNERIEQFVRLPIYGDIKLLMEKRCHTIRLHVVCISQDEVSARDIRSRLILTENKPSESMLDQSSWDDSRDGVRTPINLYSPASSTTSFFSAEEYALEDRIKETTTQHSLLPLEEMDDSTTAVTRKASLTVYIRGFSIIVMQEMCDRPQRVEVASMCFSDLIIKTISNPRSLTLNICIGDFQLDNQMYDQGGFDFPVVLISQQPYIARGPRFSVATSMLNNITETEDESLIVIDGAWEIADPIYTCKYVRIKIGPISAYIEDTFITQLLEYTTSTVPPCFVTSVDRKDAKQRISLSNVVSVPECIIIDATNLSAPIRLQKFTIEPLSVLLSVHTSVRLYVALDHSPLQFGTFERQNLLTTPYRLGNALTMHYLSGAIFGAGWVVGSLEILGSPGGFAQALGYGLRDFVALPIQGLLNGPWGFIMGITHGSASLMKHLTAGTVNSVTKLASSVARNLDRLTLDEEHLQRQEESRRTRPQGMAQGLFQGLTGFGMSLLAAVAGLAHHPLQQVLSGEATTRGLVTGVGLGIVGAVTKPLSGAAELVALTGQGLLEGTGWNPLPAPRQRPTIEYIDRVDNTSTQYTWRLLPLLAKNHDYILHVAKADYLINDGAKRAVMLILTRQTLLLVNVTEDSVEKIYFLKELTSVEHSPESTLLCLYCLPNKSQPERSSSPTEYPEMDQVMRARVEQFVRGSSTGCASVSANSVKRLDTFEAPQFHPDNILTFHVQPEVRNYLLSLFEIAKRQSQGSDFIVL